MRKDRVNRKCTGRDRERESWNRSSVLWLLQGDNGKHNKPKIVLLETAGIGVTYCDFGREILVNIVNGNFVMNNSGIRSYIL
jgi:hypothetical protein